MSDAFVGRGDELAAVRAAGEEARAGHPLVVLLEGEAGSGKTTLARRALAQLGADATVVSMPSDELTAAEPLSLVRAWVDPATADSPLAAGMALLDRLGELAGGPLLAVFVEDLHWADPMSRAALLLAARRLDHERLLILVTTRVDDDAGWARFADDPDRCRRVSVGPLGVREVMNLAAARGVSLAGHAARRLHEHTAGNALYVATLLRESSAEQLNAAGDELPVPRSLAATVAAGVAALPAEPRELLGALAVLNAPTPLPRVAAVAGVTGPAEALEVVTATGYVTWRPHQLVGPLAFSHPLYRAAVYHALPAPRRRELHLAAAAVTDRMSALAHRVAAADQLDEALADELDAAAQEATVPAQRAQLLEWSSALTADQARTEQRVLRAAQVLLDAGSYAPLERLRPQLDACSSSPRHALVDGVLAWHDGDAATSERHLLDAAGGSDPDVAAIALVQLSGVYNTYSRGREAVDTATRALDLGDDRPGLAAAAWSARAVGIAMLEGAAAGLDAIGERLTAAPGDVAVTDATLLSVRGMLNHFAARPTAAVADLREVTGRLRRRADADRLRRSHVHLAQSQFISGRWDDALINAHIALDLLIEDDHRWERAQAHQPAAYVHAGRGQWDDAQRHVDAAVAAAASSRTGEAYFGARLAAMAIHRARREPEGILAALEPLIGDGSRVPMYTTLGWWVPYVHAFIETGRLDEAEHQLDLLVAAARLRRIEVTSRTTALRAELAAARGQLDAAVALFATATAAITPDDPMLDVATVHVDHARLLRRLGQRQAAVEPLHAARALLEPVGAAPYLAPIDAQLAEAGLSDPDAVRVHRSI